MLGQEKKDGYAGDFVLKNQKTSEAEGFKNVSAMWLDKCIDYDTAMDKIVDGQNKIQDIRGGLQDFTPAVSESGEAVLKYKDGREFIPTDHALKNIAVAGRTSDWFLRDLRENKNHQTKDEVVFKRDRGDAELLVQCLKQTLWRADRFDQEKERLWRTWSDGSMRAMLSNKYAIVNNAWVMEVIREAVPAGMLSHWRGDADNMYGNVLIPDSIRQEDDSDYGGMLSVGNSEIGTRRVSSTPSVFRAICMNGCIWDQEKGKSICQVHRGELDLDFLKHEIIRNLNEQIPLMNHGIDLLLKLRSYGNNGVSMAKIVGQVCKDFKVTKKQSFGVLKAFAVEKSEVEELANTAFGVANAFTRFGQTLADDNWVKFDTLGGQVVNMQQAQWNSTVERAKSVDDKQLEKIFGSVAV
tara:strand:- start:3229 stop:4458 length:1230 start_codon:yes stop_codon:yes gene_type:complete